LAHLADQRWSPSPISNIVDEKRDQAVLINSGSRYSLNYWAAIVSSLNFENSWWPNPLDAESIMDQTASSFRLRSLTDGSKTHARVNFISGSYAEYTRALTTGVAPIESDLPWEELAVIPESYATAWTCLFRNLELKKDQTLVIRGATSSFGQAALNMAVEAGARVIATTRNRERFKKLEDLGAYRAEIEGPDLSKRIAERKHIDAVLDLVGNSTILDSLWMLRRGGRACLAGWLGGLDPIANFNPLLQMASGVYLTFFGSFVFGTPEFPLSDVPLQSIAEKVAAGRYKAKPSRVFRFEDIREAHRVMEANEAIGKIIVRL